MASETKRLFRWFWPWQDEQEKAWLSSVAGERGLHLVSLAPPGIYTFRVGEPQPMICRLDYQYLKGQDRPGYLQLFLDAGWEHGGEMSNWQYLRRPQVEGEGTEIFTDPASKAEKHRRVLPFLVLISFVLGTQLTSSLYSRWPSTGLEVIRGLLFGMLMLLLYTVIRIGLRIRRLTGHRPSRAGRGRVVCPCGKGRVIISHSANAPVSGWSAPRKAWGNSRIAPIRQDRPRALSS